MSHIPPSQIKEINKLLLAYSAGKYHTKGRISAHRDEIDSIIAGVNMLGEELLGTTVSRDYFSSIYNSVADMLFVICPSGNVQNINNAVRKVLGYKDNTILAQNISTVVAQKPETFFSGIKKELKNKESFALETNFRTVSKNIIPVACTFSKIYDRNNKLSSYLLIAEDISERKATEQLVLQTEFKTQERERARIAEEVHSAMQYKLTALTLHLEPMNEFVRNELNECVQMTRQISFDLMPGELKKGGLNSALARLVGKMNEQKLLRFHFFPLRREPDIDKTLQIVMYRIIQEFINNTIKHANAKNILINLRKSRNSICLEIKDDGCGFNFAEKIQEARGLSNIASRVKAFNGTYFFSSKINRGTSLKIYFPLTNIANSITK